MRLNGMNASVHIHVFFTGARHPGNVSIFQAEIDISRQYGDGFDRCMTAAEWIGKDRKAA